MIRKMRLFLKLRLSDNKSMVYNFVPFFCFLGELLFQLHGFLSIITYAGHTGIKYRVKLGTFKISSLKTRKWQNVDADQYFSNCLIIGYVKCKLILGHILSDRCRMIAVDTKRSVQTSRMSNHSTVVIEILISQCIIQTKTDRGLQNRLQQIFNGENKRGFINKTTTNSTITFLAPL